MRRRIIDEKAVERSYFHVRVRLDDFLDHLDALFDGEKRLLRIVFQDGYDQPLSHPAAARNQIQVPVGDGVERTWIDCNDGWRRGQTVSC